MELELLQIVAVFSLGLVAGLLIMLLVNKVRSGSAAPTNVRREYDQYQAEVERHFEATSKKFKDMTEQYQDLYQHLSLGATSLCRPDSAAAALADQRSPMEKAAKLEDVSEKKPSDSKATLVENKKLSQAATPKQAASSNTSASGPKPQSSPKPARSETAVSKKTQSSKKH